MVTVMGLVMMMVQMETIKKFIKLEWRSEKAAPLFISFEYCLNGIFTYSFSRHTFAGFKDGAD